MQPQVLSGSLCRGYGDQHCSQGVAADHGNGAGAHDLEGLGGVVGVGHEDQQEMEYLGDDACRGGKGPAGLSPLKDARAQKCCIEACGKGCHAAGNAREHAPAPECGKPALDTANDAGDDAGRTTEEETGSYGGGVAHVHGGIMRGDTKLRT